MQILSVAEEEERQRPVASRSTVTTPDALRHMTMTATAHIARKVESQGYTHSIARRVHTVYLEPTMALKKGMGSRLASVYWH